MAYWKFVASWQTRYECFIRRLFGSHSEETPEGERLAVEEGDTLFLHHTPSPEPRTGYLYGPFVAASDAGEHIQRGAWSHKGGGFPWQVEVGWEETIYSLNLEDFFEGQDDPTADVTADPQKFTEVQGLYLTGKLRDGEPVISPP